MGFTYKECGCAYDNSRSIDLKCKDHEPKKRKPKPDPVQKAPAKEEVVKPESNNGVLEIAKELKKMKIGADHLDEPVHNTASHIATKVNNMGVNTQIEFLLKSAWTGDEIIKFFK